MKRYIDDYYYRQAMATNSVTPWLAISQAVYDRHVRESRRAIKMELNGRRLRKAERVLWDAFKEELLVHYDAMNRHFSEVNVYKFQHVESEKAWADTMLEERGRIQENIYKILANIRRFY